MLPFSKKCKSTLSQLIKKMFFYSLLVVVLLLVFGYNITDDFSHSNLGNTPKYTQPSPQIPFLKPMSHCRYIYFAHYAHIKLHSFGIPGGYE